MKAKNVLDKLKDLKLRRWGPAEYTEAKNSNRGSGSNSDVFFVPATIQPKYFFGNNPEIIEIKDYTSDIEYARFLYNKEDIISLGIEETSLNSLTQVTLEEALNDAQSNPPTKGLPINKEIFNNTLILNRVQKGEDANVFIYSTSISPSLRYIVYKISDDIFSIQLIATNLE